MKEAKIGDILTFISPITNRWETCQSTMEPSGIQFEGYLYKENIYILHSLEGPAYIIDNHQGYFINGVRYEYEDFKQFVRERKLKRLLDEKITEFDKLEIDKDLEEARKREKQFFIGGSIGVGGFA